MTSIARESAAAPDIEEVAARVRDHFGVVFERELSPDPELAFRLEAHTPGVRMSAAIEIGLNAVIVAVTDEEPRLLAVHRAGEAGTGERARLAFGSPRPRERSHPRVGARRLGRGTRQGSSSDMSSSCTLSATGFAIHASAPAGRG